MFGWLGRKIKFLAHQNNQKFTTNEIDDNEKVDFIHVHSRLQQNIDFMKEQFGENLGIIYRTLQIGRENPRKALLITIDGMVEKRIVNDNIISPLMEIDLSKQNQNISSYLKESILSVIDIEITENLYQSVNELVNGKVVLFVDRERKALIINIQDWKTRAIEEPVTESVVRGPREGFIENLQTNLVMVRRRIRNPDLKMESMSIGTRTHNKVVVAYLKGITNEKIVNEVKRRIKNIYVDSLYETGFLEQYIEDAPFSLFPTVGITEKPDVATARLLEGKVAIFVDGSPIVLTVPHLLINAFQKSDDYYTRPFYVSFMRIVRLLAFLIAIMLPGLAISLMNFHTELIPTPLFISLAEAREGVPFPLVYEILLVLLMYEWLREAGISMPRPVGQAVNIIGAVILGETAVAAGLVGSATVITIAISAIAAFLIPFLFDTIALLRILFVIVSSFFGLYGLILLGMVIVVHLASLRSFGIPYTAPLFPITFKDWVDSLIRLPIWMLISRPKILRPANLIRQKRGGWTGDAGRKKPKKGN